MAEHNGERVARLEERMDRVEEGVSNFRLFQAEARDFFSRQDERAKIADKEERRKNRSWNLRIAAIAVVLAAAEFAVHGCSHTHIAFLPEQANAPQNATIPNLR